MEMTVTKTAAKRRAAFAWVGLMAATLVGCGYQVGSGNYAEEIRETPDFTALDVADGIVAEVVVGGSREVVVTGDDNLIADLHTDVRGDTLFVEIPDVFSVSSGIGLAVRITVPELEKVQVSGGGRMKVTGIDAASFSCASSGGSVVTLAGRATEFTVDTSGGSRASRGRARHRQGRRQPQRRRLCARAGGQRARRVAVGRIEAHRHRSADHRPAPVERRVAALYRVGAIEAGGSDFSSTSNSRSSTRGSPKRGSPYGNGSRLPVRR